MKLSELFEELLAISLIDIEECKKDKDLREYLNELITDLYEKINNYKLEKGNIAYYDMWPVREVEKLKFKIVKDVSLSTEQKMILYNNFSQDEIKSLSQFRRIMIQREKG